MNRISRDYWGILLAETIALRGTCSRLAVGAIATREGQLLAAGYNGAPAGMPHCVHDDDSPCTTSVHAEVNVVASAAKYGVSLEEASLYVTHAPCVSCAGLLVNAGIAYVYYRHPYRNDHGLELLYHAGLGVGWINENPSGVEVSNEPAVRPDVRGVDLGGSGLHYHRSGLGNPHLRIYPGGPQDDEGGFSSGPGTEL